MVTPRARDRKVPRTKAKRGKRVGPSRKVVRILRGVKAHLEQSYGDGIRQVILYGSQARGDAREWSDVDVAVVVGDSLDPRGVELSLDDLLFNILLEEMENITVFAFRESVFNERSSPLILNIKAEGKII